MSSNQWVNYGIAAVGAVVVGFATFGIGLSWYIPAALFTFSATASILNAMYARPQLGNVKGLGAGSFGQKSTNNQRDAAAQALHIASASEAIAIPVVFGTVRISSNYLRYDRSTFRSVPIIERVQRDPSLVAYEQAKLAYKRSPSRVDREIDSAAAKQQQAQNQGGKGSTPTQPPPSTYASTNDKINSYTQILLSKDAEGKRKLPIEYDEFVVGYRYYLSFELGICMGPVDRLERVRSYPGEGAVIDNTATPDVTASNSYAFTARGQDEGGALRFYPGKLNQTRETGDIYKTDWTNYRGVAFAMLTDFYLGTSPTPRSYAFELTRFPVCLDADGDPLADFPVRGATAGTTKSITAVAWASNVRTFTATAHGLSPGQRVSLEGFAPTSLNGWAVVVTTPTADTFTTAGANPGPITTLGLVRSTHPSYYDANPAAVLYEIFTNTRWGRGMSPDDIDIDSFRTAAQFFEANNIGMSFNLETQNVVSDATEIIRNHVSTLVLSIAGRLRCICLLDRNNAYSPRIRITSENVIDPQMSRPGWVSTVNELRGEFLNRLNNFQNEIVIAHDDGNLATVQRINSMKLSLPAFSNRDTAERMTRMLIQQMAYPQGSLKFTMNRFESRLEPGMFVEFVWTEWSSGPTTTYWRVAEIDDQDQDDDGIAVTLIEDIYATPVQGIAETFEPPVPAYEGGVVNDDDDVYLGDEADEPFDSGAQLFQIIELPIFISDGEKLAALFGERDSGRVHAVSFFAREDGSGDDFTALGVLQPWATFGELVDNVSAAHFTHGDTAGQFEIELVDPTKRAIMLEICSLAPTDSDDFESMLAAETNLLVVGEEIMQIAQAEPGSTDSRVLVTVVVRGQFGTERLAHTAGDRAIFLFEFVPLSHTFRYSNLAHNTLLEFKAITFDQRGNQGLTYTWTDTLTNRARRAMPIEEWSTAGTAGLAWEVEFRPRFHNRGASVWADIDADVNTQTGEIPDLYDFWVMPQDSGDVDLLDAPVKMTVTLVPEDGEDPATGMISFAYTAPATTDHLIFYQAYDGVLGYPVQLDPP